MHSRKLYVVLIFEKAYFTSHILQLSLVQFSVNGLSTFRKPFTYLVCEVEGNGISSKPRSLTLPLVKKVVLLGYISWWYFEECIMTRVLSCGENFEIHYVTNSSETAAFVVRFRK